MVLFVFVSFVGLAFKYMQINTYGSDESHYLLEAKYYVDDRNSFEIDMYMGEKEGTYQIDDHGPLWTVLLADAMFFSNNDDRNPLVLKILFIILVASMIISLFNVTSIIIDFRAGMIAMIVAFGYRYLIHFPLAGSRDGFRYISLFLLMALLYEFVERCRCCNSDISYGTQDFLITVFFTFLCINGHGGNAYFVVSLLLAAVMLILCVVFHQNYTDVKKVIGYSLRLSAAIGIGIIAGLVKNIYIYLKYGSFRSYTSFAYRGLSYDNYGEYIDVKSSNNICEKMNRLLMDYTYLEIVLLVIAILVFCFSVLYLLRVFCSGRIEDEYNEVWSLLVSVVFFGCLMLPLSGMFNFIAGDVQKWFFVQLRYRIYIYIYI